MYIYKLDFPTGEFYIGKTATSLDTRFRKHCTRLESNSHHSKKMQRVYNKYKQLPSITVLEEVVQCSEINNRERFWIKELDAVNSGLNSTEGGEGPGIGEYNHQAKYSLDDYLAIVVFLADTDMSLIDIANELDVTIKTVQHISCGESHQYLKEMLPREYEIMISKKGTRKLPTRSYEYPDLLSPDGKIYKVTNMLQFSKEHGLDSSTLSKLFRGKAKSTKGWKVALNV